MALDWGKVLEVVTQNARQAGVAERYQLLPGDALTVEYGNDFDVVLATNFFHPFDPAACQSVMTKMHDCLTGRVITLEFVPNEDRISPRIPATFALTMLGLTEAGDAYTFSEYDRMFRASGFTRNEIHPVPRSVQRVIVSHR